MWKVRVNDILDIEIILTRKKYPKIYNLGIIIFIIILIFIYIIFTYNYQTYYISKGKALNNNLELLVNIEDIKYITNNKVIIHLVIISPFIANIIKAIIANKPATNWNIELIKFHLLSSNKKDK